MPAAKYGLQKASECFNSFLLLLFFSLSGVAFLPAVCKDRLSRMLVFV